MLENWEQYSIMNGAASFQETYGMSSNGKGFVKQYDKQMQKKVGKNISVADYFKEKANIMGFLVEGEDSCQTRTQGLYSNVELWPTRLLNL